MLCFKQNIFIKVPHFCFDWIFETLLSDAIILCGYLRLLEIEETRTRAWQCIAIVIVGVNGKNNEWMWDIAYFWESLLHYCSMTNNRNCTFFCLILNLIKIPTFLWSIWRKYKPTSQRLQIAPFKDKSGMHQYSLSIRTVIFIIICITFTSWLGHMRYQRVFSKKLDFTETDMYFHLLWC